MDPSYRPRSIFVLPILTFAEFAGTSIWFAPNAVVSQIPNFGAVEIAALTSLVQVGFIVGTFTLTYYAVADRYDGPTVFMVMGLIGATFNVLCIASSSFAVWAILRTLVGICLAGVYPVGMKIAAKQYPDGLGPRLGVLIAALTLGTAFPWLIRGISESANVQTSNGTAPVGGELPYEATVGFVSGIAVLGALAIPVVMLAPGTRHKSLHRLLSCGRGEGEDASPDKPKFVIGREAIRTIWSVKSFRAAAMGYWGHMFELYAFWAFVPELIKAHHGPPVVNHSTMTFLTIAIGAVSSVLAGLWSTHAGKGILPGSAVAATTSLIVSMVCCVVAPLYQSMSPIAFLLFVLVWGFAVIADSGQYSTLCAGFAHKELVGTALTMTTCVGFAITIISIQIVGAVIKAGVDPGVALLILFPGPLIGVIASYRQWPLHKLCQHRLEVESDDVEKEIEEVNLERT